MVLNFDKQQQMYGIGLHEENSSIKPYEPIKQLASINEICQQIRELEKQLDQIDSIQFSKGVPNLAMQCNNVMYKSDMKITPFDIHTG